ncbi:MAG TPA: tetratricopeptide repeat protein [Bacteroidia bacterium]|nr:tetratricopeptide repeat protein [Bacteroidia bacterium]
MKSCSPQPAEEKPEVSNGLLSVDTSPEAVTSRRKALQSAQELNDIPGQALALNALGVYHFHSRHTDSALHYYQASLALSRKHNLLHQQVLSLEKISACYIELARYDEAFPFLHEALAVSRKENLDEDIAISLQELGIFHMGEGDYDSALVYFEEELLYDEQLKDSTSLASCYGNMATINLNRGFYSNSILYYKKALVIAENSENYADAADCNSNIAIAYKNQDAYDTALTYLLKAARYFDESNAPKQKYSCYTNIGSVHLEMGDTDQAMHYFSQALAISDSIQHKRGIAISHNNIAEVFIKEGKYDSALVSLNRALVLKEELGDTNSIAITLDLIGRAFYLRKNFPEAERFYLRAQELKNTQENPKGKATGLNNLGELYSTWGKNDLALEKLNEGRVILESIGAKSILLENYALSADVLRAQGNLEGALEFHEKHSELMDHVMNERRDNAVAEMDVKYETEKKEDEIISLQDQKRAQAERVDWQHKLIYSLAGGAVLLVIVIVTVYRSRRKALKQSNIIIEQKQIIIDQKQTMMRELHHRIKNNLQVLSSILELQQNKMEDGHARDLMKAIDHRLNAMLLIHQGLYDDGMSSQVSMPEYIASLVNNLCQSFGYSRQDLRIKTNIEPLRMDADQALSLGFICNEVISNWFKHALRHSQNPELSIFLSQNLLVISDNGPGIAGGIDSVPANSFGLRMIRLFAQQLRGKLTLVSDIHGTIVTLELPEPTPAS